MISKKDIAAHQIEQAFNLALLRYIKKEGKIQMLIDRAIIERGATDKALLALIDKEGFIYGEGDKTRLDIKGVLVCKWDSKIQIDKKGQHIVITLLP